MLENGDGILENKEEAYYYYKLAIDKRKAKMIDNYSSQTRNSDCFILEREEEAHTRKEKADNGDPTSM